MSKNSELIELAKQIRKEFARLDGLMEEVLARAEEQGGTELALDSCRRIMTGLGHQTGETNDEQT